MLRSTLRLVAAALLAVGLLFAPSAAGAKSKKSDKKASSRDAKKDSKHDKKDKTAKKDKGKSKKDRRSDDRTAKRSKHDDDRTAKVSKRGKNGDDDADDTATRARRTAPPPSPTVAKRVVDGDDTGDDGDDAEEPPGPKPANRLVADMSPVRVTQIQTALISKGFLVGPPNGIYDQPTFQAMAAFQTRNGWNGVGVPTADALKALGVPKTSGRTYMAPSRVVEATAPQP